MAPGDLNKDGDSVIDTITATENGFGFTTVHSIEASSVCWFVRIVVLIQDIVTDWIEVGIHSVSV